MKLFDKENGMKDRDYVIKSMKDVTLRMTNCTQNYLNDVMRKHYGDIKLLLNCYRKLILENQMILKDLEMEYQEEISEDMGYVIIYFGIYSKQLDISKLNKEMNNLVLIYGLSDMIHRGITLVKYYAPNGVLLSAILYACFCRQNKNKDVEIQQELGIGRTLFYKMKKQALEYMGFYFYEIVIPQARKMKIEETRL